MLTLIIIIITIHGMYVSLEFILLQRAFPGYNSSFRLFFFFSFSFFFIQ